MTLCLVFGKTGQVAQAITRSAQDYPDLELIQLDRSQADFTNPESLAAPILEHRPTVVINAAAYTKVDQAENDEATSVLVNAEAPRAIATACAKINAVLIHLSTDYVFAGDAKTPYLENAPIGPTGAYGRTKAQGEQAIGDQLDHHLIIRTAWVYSDTGQNFLKTMLRLERDIIRVVDDQHGNPTPASAIAKLCLDMTSRIVRGNAGPWGTYHFSGQPATTWFGFAKSIFDEAEKLGRPAQKLEPITTDQYPTPARRPAWSVLDNSKIIKEWGISPPDWQATLPSLVNSLLHQG